MTDKSDMSSQTNSDVQNDESRHVGNNDGGNGDTGHVEGTVKTHKRRPRKPISCEPCRRSKLRCDRQTPCATCRRRAQVSSCLYGKQQTGGPTHMTAETNNNNNNNPAADQQLQQRQAFTHGRWEEVLQRPMNQNEQSPPPPPPPPPSLTPSSLTPSSSTAGIRTTNNNHNNHNNTTLNPQSNRSRNHNGHHHHHVDHGVKGDNNSNKEGLSFPFALDDDGGGQQHQPRMTTTEEILSMMPPPHCLDFLIARYTTTMGPFFNILHGPTFQREYNTYMQGGSSSSSAVDLSWLALLLMIVSIALATLEYDDQTVLVEAWPGMMTGGFFDVNATSRQFQQAARTCLARDQFLTSYRLHTLQALLLLIYKTGHEEGVEKGWTLLGVALNMAIALQCNAEWGKNLPVGGSSTTPSCLEIERRRRCWAGLLSLYTYQTVTFPGIHIMFLTNITATMPADVNDCDINEDTTSIISVLPSSGQQQQPTQMSVMMFKIRLFELSSRICRHLKEGGNPDDNNKRLDETVRDEMDREIAREQQKWDEAYLIDGRPSLWDFSSYAKWLFLQLHGLHLYLLVHQPFCRSRSSSSSSTSTTSTSSFRQGSRSKCIESGAALLDMYRQLWESPGLRPWRWTLHGMMSFYALHGAVALASCLLDEDGSGANALPHRQLFTSAVERMEILQRRSSICVKAYPILYHLQTLLFPNDSAAAPDAGNASFIDSFDTWVDSQQWLSTDTVDWNILDDIIDEDGTLLQ